MQWAEDFYTKQDAWSGCYTGLGEPRDDDHARIVTATLAGWKGRILEPGAGGGQSELATAQLGQVVTALELVGQLAAHARTLVPQADPGTLHIVEGNFYTLTIPDVFDAICYWDGFGVGTDAQQRRLLHRIARWLTPLGTVVMDINTPWYWAKASGHQMCTSTYVRAYGFDADGCRLLDHWWPAQRPDERVTQSLRCYSPQDLRLLLEGTGLALERVEPGGARDYDAGTYTSTVPLKQTMQYRTYLRHC